MKTHNLKNIRSIRTYKSAIDRPKSKNPQELYLEEMQMKFNPGQSLSLLLSLPERY
jgi:hypothetical protein